MRNNRKIFAWIAVNVLILLAILLIGQFYPQTQQTLTLVMQIYAVLVCVLSAFFSFQRESSKKFTRYTKIFVILWVIIGIFLITLFIMKIFDALPLLLMYVFISPIAAVFTYNMNS